MSKTQKLLLVLSVAFLVAAEIIKRLPLSEKATLIVGLIEILVAIAVGFAFGITRNQDEGRSEK